MPSVNLCTGYLNPRCLEGDGQEGCMICMNSADNQYAICEAGQAAYPANGEAVSCRAPHWCRQ